LIVQPPHTCAMCVSEGGLTNVAAGGPLDVEREIDTLLMVAVCTSSSPRLGIRRPQAERDPHIVFRDGTPEMRSRHSVVCTFCRLVHAGELLAADVRLR
jgi:hypothetical protein